MSNTSPSTSAAASLDADAVHDKAKRALGMVPNLIKEIAEHNPTVADTYLEASSSLSNGQLSGAEEQVVILAISSYNDCHYCTKAHAAAGKAAGLSAETVETIVAGGLPEAPRHRRLVQATRQILGKRGWLSDADQAELAADGLERDVLYEIVALIGVKTISNYVNHIAGTKVDGAFQ